MPQRKSLRIAGRVLIRLYFQLVDNLLHIRDLLRELLGLMFLGRSLYAALQNQRSILRGAANALIVEISVRFD